MPIGGVSSQSSLLSLVNGKGKSAFVANPQGDIYFGYLLADLLETEDEAKDITDPIAPVDPEIGKKSPDNTGPERQTTEITDGKAAKEVSEAALKVMEEELMRQDFFAVSVQLAGSLGRLLRSPGRRG